MFKLADQHATVDQAVAPANEFGEHVYYCFIETHGGHWNYGMVGKILISQPAAPA